MYENAKEKIEKNKIKKRNFVKENFVCNLKLVFKLCKSCVQNFLSFVHGSSNFLYWGCGLVGNFSQESYPSIVCKNFENQNFVHDASNPHPYEKL